MQTIETKMKEKFGYVNALQIPRIVKVVVSSGVGSVAGNKERLKHIQETIAQITGQKPENKPAKKSIASFKIREGALSGYSVTLRGLRMNDFLQKLTQVALPRIRDFRGLPSSSIDNMGNLSIGFRDHTVFPEAIDHDIRSSFSLGVTIVTTARTKEEARTLFELIGFPFTREENPDASTVVKK